MSDLAVYKRPLVRPFDHSPLFPVVRGADGIGLGRYGRWGSAFLGAIARGFPLLGLAAAIAVQPWGMDAEALR
jgi:hypothetical protein